MRELWIVTHYSTPPRDDYGGSRHQSLAVELLTEGWHTTVLSASTSHPEGMKRSLSAPEEHTSEGVSWRIFRVPGYRGNGFGRIINMVAFSLQVLRLHSTRGLPRPDVVIGSTVHILAAWAALRLSRRHDVPFVFEVRDLWPETLIDMGVISQSGLIARLMRALEGRLYRSASLIVTTMPNAHEYISATFGVDRSKVVWISNGTVIDDFAPTPLPRTDTFEFLYFGSHGRANDLRTIIAAFKKTTATLGPGKSRLRLVGDGPEKPDLIAFRDQLGLGDAVLFDPPVVKSQIPSIAQCADALVVSLLPLRLYRFGISLNKLADYLAAARPIILAGDPVNNPVREAQAGIWCQESSADTIAAAMIAMVETSYEQRTIWARHGRELAEAEYSYRHLAERLADHLDGIRAQT